MPMGSTSKIAYSRPQRLHQVILFTNNSGMCVLNTHREICNREDNYESICNDETKQITILISSKLDTTEDVPHHHPAFCSTVCSRSCISKELQQASFNPKLV